MFAPDSRYYGLGTYTVTLANGQVVTATNLPLPKPDAGVTPSHALLENAVQLLLPPVTVRSTS